MNKIRDFEHIEFHREREKLWNGPFYFIQGADTQFGMIASFFETGGSVFETNGWEREKELAKICVEKINRLSPKPKFFVICGDLCDAWPYGTSEETRRLQEKDFIEIFSKIDKDIPLVCVCGNHDVGNQPTIETVNRYRSVFGQDFYSFFCGGVKFIVLNSQYYMDGSKIKELVGNQDTWLQEQLADPGSLPGPIVFQHVPPFLRDPEETDGGYFSLEYSERMKLLSKLYSSGVRYVFCGHYHRNAGGFYNDMEVIVTSAVGAQLGTDKSGFRIVHVDSKEKITHKYYAFEDVPEVIKI